MDCNNLIDERAKLVIEARSIVDTAEKEGRSLTGEDNAKWDKIMSDVDALSDRINTAQKVDATRKAEAELQKSYRKTSPQPIAHKRDGNRGEALRTWLLRSTNKAVTPDDIDNAAACGIDLSSQFATVSLRSGKAEQRAMTKGNGLDVYDFGQDFDRALKAYGNAISLVKTINTPTGLTLQVPTVDDSANLAVIVGEGSSIAVTPDPTTSSVSLGAYKYSTKGIQVSLELLQDSVLDLEILLADLLAERLGRALNNHITNGTGSSQPNGIFPRATASGVVVGGTVASPTFSIDNVYDLIAAVDPAYRQAPNAGFMMSDATLWRFRKLKDTTGQYLWQPSVQAGQPDRLAGYPVYVNQDAPALAVNAKVAAFGDFSRYMWRQVADLQMYRLDQLYIMNGQIAFVGLYRGDGNLLNTAAIKTLAAPAS